MASPRQNTSHKKSHEQDIQSAKQQLMTLIVLVSLCNESSKNALELALNQVFSTIPNQLTNQAIKNARRDVLDLFEATFGDSKRWNFIRSRTLRIFGADGLEQVLQR
jgi:hypothetical protein